MFILAPVLAFCVAWAYTALSNHLALKSWRASAQEHWTERARILYPVRIAASANVWMFPVNCTLLCWILLSNHWVVLAAVFVFALCGAIGGSYRFDRELFPRFTLRNWLQFVSVSIAMRFGFWFMVPALVFCMPEELGWQACFVGAVAVAFLISLHFGFWILLLQKGRLLAPPPQRLVDIAEAASRKAGVSYRGLWQIRTPAGYAAALPLTRDLIFSEGLLYSHPDNEIAAVCAHELAHLNESRTTLFMRTLSTLWIVPLIFIRPVGHEFQAQGMLLLLLVVTALIWMTKRLGRRMEERADQSAKDQQEEAGVYASALERLYQMNHIPAVMPNDRMIHPHLYDRLLAAGATPAYPRPAKPEKMAIHGKLMSMALGVLIVAKLVRAFAS